MPFSAFGDSGHFRGLSRDTLAFWRVALESHSGEYFGDVLGNFWTLFEDEGWILRRRFTRLGACQRGAWKHNTPASERSLVLFTLTA